MLDELEDEKASAPPRSPAPLSPTAADAESEEEMIAPPPASWDGGPGRHRHTGRSYTAAEDARLWQMVEDEGAGHWPSKAMRFGNDRSDESLRIRWNLLKKYSTLTSAAELV